jgi:predicted small lipoprotein YifL
MVETAQNKGDGIILIGCGCSPANPRFWRPICYGASRFRESRVIRPSDRSLVYLAAVATLIAALSLAACGRKSGLDAPPSSLPGSPEPQASNSQPPGVPGLFAPTTPAPQNQTAAPQNQTAQTTPPQQKKSFFLDWLVN